jgi:hypothetical protein
MFRYSLLTLFGVISAIAVVCAALMYSTNLTAQCAVSTVLAALALSTLVAVFGHGRLRVIAGGFAIFGWIYSSVAFANVTVLLTGWERDQLLTNEALVQLHRVIFGSAETAETTPYEPDFMYSPKEQERRARVQNFFRIGHSAVALMLGLAGGWIGSLLFQHRPRADDSASAHG